MTVDTTLTAQDEADLQSIFGVDAANVQSGVSVTGTAITGTSKKLDSVNTFDMEKGHHFLLLHITADDADTIEVSMHPSQGTIGVLDESGVVLLQMKDDQSQSVRINAIKNGYEFVTDYDITGMTFEE